jgi:ribonuclease BN (tRNA processing enzyme)
MLWKNYEKFYLLDCIELLLHAMGFAGAGPRKGR